MCFVVEVVLELLKLLSDVVFCYLDQGFSQCLALGAFLCFAVIGSYFTRSLMVSVPIVLKILGVWLTSVCRCKASLGRSLLLSIPSVLKTPGT